MFVLFIFVLGLIFGSFVNALVWRVHKKRKWWGNERSICPKCKHKLSAKDLVPVISWLALKGKCRYCHKPISAQYPVVELLTACLFALSYNYWPYSFSALGILALLVWLFCVVIFVALTVYDIKWLILPNKMVVALTGSSLLLAILLAIEAGGSNFFNKIFSALLSGILFFGIFYGLIYFSDGKWIGGGDVKMAFALGLLAGSITKVVMIIFLASCIGTLVTVPLLLTKKLNLTAKVAFGPLLIIATIITFLFGTQLINWYSSTFLYI